ncbi:MAG TPA: hypothetical protein VGB17_02945 [Pyrinomonadaceae bacterium]|jgi:hypothetical protein
MEFLLRQSGDRSNPILPRLYGKGSTRGIPYIKAQDGDRWKFLSFLAAGGRYGCDGIDRVKVSGADFPEFDGSSVRQWRFHPGTRSTGYGDAVQGRPEFWPELDLVFSYKSYIEGLLPEGEDDPNNLEIFMRGLKLMDYSIDVNGNLQKETPVFSANNSLASLDVLREVGKMPLTRFNRWADSWIEFRDVCNEELEWNKGSEVISVPRYDAHIPFSQQIDPTTAFEAIMLRAPGCGWQDVNGGVRILTTPDREPVHRFTFDPTQFIKLSNIAKNSFSGTPRAPEDIYNYLIFSYRDIESDVYEEKFIDEDRAELRDMAGGILNQLGPIELGLMYESLAQRIAKSMVRLLCDAPYTRQFDLKGQMDSYHVAKLDNVEITHDSIDVRETEPLTARVLKETFEPKKGERSFTLQLIDPDNPYYRDTDHGPKQNP